MKKIQIMADTFTFLKVPALNNAVKHQWTIEDLLAENKGFGCEAKGKPYPSSIMELAEKFVDNHKVLKNFISVIRKHISNAPEAEITYQLNTVADRFWVKDVLCHMARCGMLNSSTSDNEFAHFSVAQADPVHDFFRGKYAENVAYKRAQEVIAKLNCKDAEIILNAAILDSLKRPILETDVLIRIGSRLLVIEVKSGRAISFDQIHRLEQFFGKGNVLVTLLNDEYANFEAIEYFHSVPICLMDALTTKLTQMIEGIIQNSPDKNTIN